MTLTKARIIKSVKDKLRLKNRKKAPQQFLFPEMDYISLNQGRATEIVESLFEIIKRTLASGEDVRIPGFGKFHVQHKRPRRGRNPQTGEEMILRSRKIVGFSVSPKLREKINFL
ncbi:MAG: integration host factor subunit alpha [Desulfobacterales bacterium]|nr:integration host factor subunit alpha [Desulfobacterales bacterium]